MSMPAVTRTPRLTPEERSAAARIGGRARFAAMTPEQQRAFQRRAAIASRISNVILDLPETTPGQRRRLWVALRDFCLGLPEITPGQRSRLWAALRDFCESPEAGCDQ